MLSAALVLLSASAVAAGNAVLPKDITFIVPKASQTRMKLSAPAMASDKEVINVGGIEGRLK